MSIVYRDYQNAIDHGVREEMRKGHRKVLIQSPTGSGKTAMAARMLKSASEKKNDSWFVCNRIELVKQTMSAFDKIGVRYGVVNANFPPDLAPYIQICSIQTLVKRIHLLRKPKLIYWDEARGVGAKTWESVFRANPQAFHVGLDATPWRLDGRGMGDFFDVMVKGPEVKSLIEKGFLSNYKAYAPSGVDLSGIHTRMGDFVKAEINSLMNKPTITGSAVSEYLKRAAGKRNIVFCVSIEHSQQVAKEFNARGIPAKHIDGTMGSDERDRALLDFAAGRILALTSVDLVTAGLDIPAIECVQILRPTSSLSLWIQMIGRGLRPFPGKSHLIILDHVNGFETHGLPDDIREWSLEGREVSGRAKKSQEVSVRICSSCFAAQQSGPPICSSCGEAFEIKSRQIEKQDGELNEVDAAKIRAQRERKQQQGTSATLESLIELGKKRGYRNPNGWAKAVFNARQLKKLQRGR